MILLKWKECLNRYCGKLLRIAFELVNDDAPNFLYVKLTIDPHRNLEALVCLRFYLLRVLLLSIYVFDNIAHFVIDQNTATCLRRFEDCLFFLHNVAENCNYDFAYINVDVTCLYRFLHDGHFLPLVVVLFAQKVRLDHFVVCPVV